MPKQKLTPKIMITVASLALGSMVGGLLASAQSEPVGSVRAGILMIGEAIEQREETDRTDILSLDRRLTTACKAHAIRYSGGSHDLARAKVEMVLGVREIQDWPEPPLAEFGNLYLDDGCPSGLLLQLINRHHEMERFVDEGLLSLTTGAVL